MTRVASETSSFRGRLLVESSFQGKLITEVCATEQGGGPRSGSFDEIIFQGSSSVAEVAAHFLNRKVLATHRRGKQMWLTLGGNGLQPTFHFGMTGSFAVKGGESMEYQRYTVDTAVWPPRFCKLELVAEDGTRLAFVNSRRLGRVRFFDDPCAHPPISALGFDPLLDLPSVASFTAALASRGQAIKAVLLDQSFSAGVGNWIADEVVYQARVHPSHPCRSLTEEEAGRLHDALGSVVGTAVAANADSKKFPPSWLFHFRWAKGAAGAKDAAGNPIAFVTVGGRTSAVVAAVQGSGKEWKTRDAMQHIGSHSKPEPKPKAARSAAKKLPASGPAVQVAAKRSPKPKAAATKGSTTVKAVPGDKTQPRPHRGTKRARVAALPTETEATPSRRRSARLK